MRSPLQANFALRAEDIGPNTNPASTAGRSLFWSGRDGSSEFEGRLRPLWKMQLYRLKITVVIPAPLLKHRSEATRYQRVNLTSGMKTPVKLRPRF